MNVKNLIKHLKECDNQELEVFIFDNGDITPIDRVDISISDRVDLNINEWK